MMRLFLVLVTALGLLAGCSNDGARPGTGQTKFKITAADEGRIQLRHLDAVNELRKARGLAPLELSAELTAAAKTHAFDISRQNRPWHFGSDGSNPLDRAARAGYTGVVLGENLSETFEDDLQTLNAWMGDSETRSNILHPAARTLGLSWHQEKSGKIWWVQLVGT